MNNLDKFMDFNIKPIEEKDGETTIEIGPLPTGFGYTLGNVYRRVLLSSIKGAAITEIKIDGVSHQFTTVEGMKEDVARFILNIKRIKVKLLDESDVVLKLEVSGPREIKAGDITKNANVEIVNPDLYLGTLTTKSAKLNIQLTVEPGYGYVARESLEYPKIGVLPIDSLFSPVTHVSYIVEQTRVGEQTDLDKLILKVTTDGTIEAMDALKKSSALLVSFFRRISEGEKEPEFIEIKQESVIKNQRLTSKEKEILISDLDLPLRTINSLKRGKITTLGDLLETDRETLLEIRGLGETSITQIEDLLEKESWK